MAAKTKASSSRRAKAAPKAKAAPEPKPAPEPTPQPAPPAPELASTPEPAPQPEPEPPPEPQTPPEESVPLSANLVNLRSRDVQETLRQRFGQAWQQFVLSPHGFSPWLLFTPPAALAEAKGETDVTLTPEDARHIAGYCPGPDKATVAEYAKLMRRNRWKKGSPISFLHCGPWLLQREGRHRLHAQAIAGATVTYRVTIHERPPLHQR